MVKGDEQENKWRPRKTRNVCGVTRFKGRVGFFFLSVGKKQVKRIKFAENGHAGSHRWAFGAAMRVGRVVDGQARET